MGCDCFFLVLFIHFVNSKVSVCKIAYFIKQQVYVRSRAVFIQLNSVYKYVRRERFLYAILEKFSKIHEIQNIKAIITYTTYFF